MDHPTLVILRGLPGSGKSYITNILKNSLADQVGTSSIVILDPDATDYSSAEYLAHTKALTDEGVDSILHAYRYLRSKAYKGIETKKIIVWNQPFTNLEIFNKMISGLKSYAQDHKTTLNVLVVEVEIDPSTAKKRVNKRKLNGGHGPSDNTFKRFTNDYASFAPHGYNTVTVYGDDDASASVLTIMHALEDILA
jgi:thymidylate kinase